VKQPRYARWAIITCAFLVAGTIAARFGPALIDEVGDMLDDEVALPRLVGPAWPMKTIVLERSGGTFLAGRDDAATNRSSVVEHGKKERAQIPAFRGSDANWKRFVSCVRKKFATLDVAVVEQRPPRDYILVMVGGTPDLVGARGNVTGLAPFNGDPIEDPVVFVFSRALREDVRGMCDTAAHEIAHAYGVDHEYLCRDPMTYLGYCGDRQFQDVDAPCGEKKKRPCQGGALTQNSFRTLREVLGTRTIVGTRSAPSSP
jgi:hypothetical protein